MSNRGANQPSTMTLPTGAMPAIGRGRLMTAQEIAQEIFRGSVSEQWVKRNVAQESKRRLGHSTVRWWEADVVAWISKRHTP